MCILYHILYYVCLLLAQSGAMIERPTFWMKQYPASNLPAHLAVSCFHMKISPRQLTCVADSEEYQANENHCLKALGLEDLDFTPEASLLTSCKFECVISFLLCRHLDVVFQTPLSVFFLFWFLFCFAMFFV